MFVRLWLYLYLFPGHVGSDVLLATNEDELLVFGLNKSGCLVQKGPQYDSQYDDESLEKIEELSKKRVKGDERKRSIILFVFLNLLNLDFIPTSTLYIFKNLT